MTVSSNTTETFKVVTAKSGRVVVERPVSAAENVFNVGGSTLVLTADNCVVADGKLPSLMDTESSVDAYALLGVLRLAYTSHLLVVTHRVLAATVQAHKIWRVTGVIAVPISAPYPNDLSKAKRELKEKDLAKFLLDQSLLESTLEVANSGHLYYSSSYDLTHSIQHNYFSYQVNPSDTVVDDRYFFNHHLMHPISSLASASTNVPWVYKMICGFVGGIDIPVQHDPTASPLTFTTVLVSRLSTARLGTRYVRRGLDMQGNAANSVEMEQIVFNHDFHSDAGISSFVQLRGSAPLVWSQERDLAYRPEMHLKDFKENADVWGSVEQHLKDLKRQYIGDLSVSGGRDFGQIVCVNLLDDAGFEGALTKAYQSAINRFSDEKVQYEEFPMNKWCRNMDYKNMSILVNRVHQPLVNSQVFVANGDVPFTSQTLAHGNRSRPFKVSKLQTGVTRVSCLDSLDRTNLTCSILALHMLPSQIQSLVNPEFAKPNLKPYYSPVSATQNSSEPIDEATETGLIRSHVQKSKLQLSNLWADSGDAISLLYAGTRALKSDVTRTGSRQKIRGPLDDGLNSLTRYYLNHFSDGKKQDAYDIWSGKVSGRDEIWNTFGGDENPVWADRARSSLRPFLPETGVLGAVVPKPVRDGLEPLLQETRGFVGGVAGASVDALKGSVPVWLLRRGHATSTLKVANASRRGSQAALEGDAQAGNRAGVDKQRRVVSYAGFLASTAKIYAPKKVTNVTEFAMAMLAAMYILAVARLFRVRGSDFVDRPSLDDKALDELALD
ncbi:hypothetical protein HDU77_003009 [Chytriomyces hyalinus]|nr:hypothetical protein HDU77_003009 [Chytriomyces hyalinus]